MTESSQTEGLSFSVDKILRLNSPASPTGDRGLSSDHPEHWQPAPLAASQLRQPLAAGSGRSPPPSPQSARLLSLTPPLYPLCAPLPPLLPLTPRLGRPLAPCQACPDVWPLTCHHHLLPASAEAAFPASLVAGRRLGSRRKRTWTRAVFTNLQRKGLEKRFTVQRYITKPERRKLAETLGLTDSQVKVWFQNRRMKWRNSRRLTESPDEPPVADSTQLSADDEAAQPINVED